MKYLLLLLTILTTKANDNISHFFANQSIQDQNPYAFILQKESQFFLKNYEQSSLIVRDRIIKKIQDTEYLIQAIKNWNQLTIYQQIPFLIEIFNLEVQALKIIPPKLVFDYKEEFIPGRAAFFDFDLNHPDSGTVLLNPKVLNKMPPFDSLSLLLHETRHSYQWQLSHQKSSLGNYYLEAFKAQRNIQITSFSDFLTLNNEHEAFYFANYIIGKLTNWTLNQPSMGTFASQFDRSEKLKIDLNLLLDQFGEDHLLKEFNREEQKQCIILNTCD